MSLWRPGEGRGVLKLFSGTPKFWINYVQSPTSFFFKQVGAEIHLGCRARIEPTDPVQGTGDNLKKIPFHSQTSPESVWEKKSECDPSNALKITLIAPYTVLVSLSFKQCASATSPRGLLHCIFFTFLLKRRMYHLLRTHLHACDKLL